MRPPTTVPHTGNVAELGGVHGEGVLVEDCEVGPLPALD